MNMRSAEQSLGGPSVAATTVGAGDLTTRARIRDAATRRFAAEGFTRTTVRAIAADAGVSPALLIHHFGSKDGLRQACDESVIGWFVEQARAEATTEGLRTVIAQFFAEPDRYRVPMDYMARAVVEGTATGAQFVDTMVDETERYVRAGMADGSVQSIADPRAMAVYIAAGSLGMLLVPDHLARNLGLEPRSPDVLRRLSGPALQLYTTGLYTDDAVLRTAEEAVGRSIVPSGASPTDTSSTDTASTSTAPAGAGDSAQGRTGPGASPDGSHRSGEKR